MKRDLDGRIDFEESEIKAMMLFSGRNRQYQLDKEYLSEMLSLDLPGIDCIVEELCRNNILKGYERTGRYELTPFGRECAAFLEAMPGLDARQREFLGRLDTMAARAGKSSGYVDRYQAGMSIGCSRIETDYICAELQSAGLIEPEMKDVTVFPGSGYERVRKIPTRNIRLTAAGTREMTLRNKGLADLANEKLETKKRSGKIVESASATAPGLSGDSVRAAGGLDADQAVENISGFLRSIVLMILAMVLIIFIAFYK